MENTRVAVTFFRVVVSGHLMLLAYFFQKYWAILSTVLGILNKNQSTSQINHTYITLVPKSKNPRNMTQFRPISLCNVIYKLVTKTFANRLKLILHDVISRTQSAFVLGHLITDNAILGFESMHKLKTHTHGMKGWYAFKLDMSKTYDRVEWPFLRRMMEKLRFVKGGLRR